MLFGMVFIILNYFIFVKKFFRLRSDSLKRSYYDQKRIQNTLPVYGRIITLKISFVRKNPSKKISAF